MALAETLQQELNSSRKGPRCTVCVMVATLDNDDKVALDTALADPAILSSVITRALKREGHSISPDALRRHRKGECVTKGRPA